jgi:uncharacterized C2H2 Zn-finger protein
MFRQMKDTKQNVNKSQHLEYKRGRKEKRQEN